MGSADVSVTHSACAVVLNVWRTGAGGPDTDAVLSAGGVAAAIDVMGSTVPALQQSALALLAAFAEHCAWPAAAALLQLQCTCVCVCVYVDGTRCRD